MDKISKSLEKLGKKEKTKVKEILIALKNNSLENCDLKRLKGFSDIFRIRKGSIRIIYRSNNKEIKVLAIERRSEKTYRSLEK